MKNKLILLLIAIVALNACNSGSKGIIPEKKMVAIITDMNLLEASMVTTGITRVDKNKREAYYNYLYKKHDITAEQLEQSMDWYSKNPDKMELIYDKVNKRLKQMESELEEKEKTEKEKTDVQKSDSIPSQSPASDSIPLEKSEYDSIPAAANS